MAVPTTRPPPLPGPWGLPGVGPMINAIGVIRDPIVEMQRLYDHYGPLVTLARGTQRTVFVFSPELNRQVLGGADGFNTMSAGTLPIPLPKDSALERAWNNGLLQQNGARHKQQRRLIMPAFHKTRVDAYRDAMVAQIDQALAGWRGGEQRDLLLDMKQLTLAIAVKTLLGLEPDQEGERVRRLLERWVEIGFSLPTLLLPVNLPGFPFHQYVQMAERLEQEIFPFIERRRRSGRDGGDALGMLIQAHDEDGTRLTDAEVLAQAGTLFIAGYITTASALTWTLFLLAQHPAVLADLLDELTGALHGAAPTVDQLGQLPLLERVVKESLRLLPPIAWSGRAVAEPVTVGPHRLHPGTVVVWSGAVTHRIPDLYPQPQRFLPERWTTITPSSYEYLPFSGGPRRCIGAEFALLEIRLVLALLLQRYRLALPPHLRVDRAGLFFMFPQGGLPARVYPQDRRFTWTPVRGNIHDMVEL